jgi:hypothetical protein
MINKLKGLLNKDKYHRKIFAVNHGTHKGHFYVYISTDEKQHNFLVLPEIDTISIEHETFETGLKRKIVAVVEKLPHNVYEICCAQYNEAKSKNNINRLKQSFTSSGVDN